MRRCTGDAVIIFIGYAKEGGKTDQPVAGGAHHARHRANTRLGGTSGLGFIATAARGVSRSNFNSGGRRRGQCYPLAKKTMPMPELTALE